MNTQISGKQLPNSQPGSVKETKTEPMETANATVHVKQEPLTEKPCNYGDKPNMMNIKQEAGVKPEPGIKMEPMETQGGKPTPNGTASMATLATSCSKTPTTSKAAPVSMNSISSCRVTKPSSSTTKDPSTSQLVKSEPKKPRAMKSE